MTKRARWAQRGGDRMTMKTLTWLALPLLTAAAPPPEPPKIRSPGDVVKASVPADWSEIAADDLMIMELAGGKRVVIQLAPLFAPVHVANIKTMARSGYWAKATIYRVVDNWVTQWGLGDGPFPTPPGVVARPPEEYQRGSAGLTLMPMGSPDPYSAMSALQTAGRSRSRPAERSTRPIVMARSVSLAM